MNNDNKVLFVFGFVFYFIGDHATNCIGINNGIPEKGFIRIIGSPGYGAGEGDFLCSPEYLDSVEKRRNYLCGAALGLVDGMGMTVNIQTNKRLFSGYRT